MRGTLRIRPTRGRDGDRELRQELAESLQFARSEAAAFDLLERHLVRIVPGASLTLPSGGSCRSARIGREFARDPGNERLLECEVCSSCGDSSVCVPGIAAGDVVAPVLVRRQAPFTNRERGRVREAIAQVAAVVANLRSLALLESQASVDALTGLPNSRALRDTLRRMIAQAGRTLSPVSVILVDLDHLGRINDVHGHERGDDVIAAAAGALSETVRASDYAGRYGGEEFLVLLPDTDREGAAMVAEKLRLAVAGLRLPGLDASLSASLGVASVPADSADPDALLRLADRALYAAKAAGRNRVEAAGLSVAGPPAAS